MDPSLRFFGVVNAGCWSVTKLYKYTLKTKVLSHTLCISEGFRKELNGDKFYPYYHSQRIIQIYNFVFVHFKSCCQIQFTTSKAKSRLKERRDGQTFSISFWMRFRQVPLCRYEFKVIFDDIIILTLGQYYRIFMLFTFYFNNYDMKLMTSLYENLLL